MMRLIVFYFMNICYVNGPTFYVIGYLRIIVTRINVHYASEGMNVIGILFKFIQVVLAALVVEKYAIGRCAGLHVIIYVRKALRRIKDVSKCFDLFTF